VVPEVLAWELVSAPADRAEVTIAYDLHAFLQLERVAVQETDDEVEITVVGRFDPPSGGWTTYEEPQRHRIDLRRPLGTRALLGCSGLADDAQDYPS
jgi:hypothetical protein